MARRKPQVLLVGLAGLGLAFGVALWLDPGSLVHGAERGDDDDLTEEDVRHIGEELDEILVAQAEILKQLDKAVEEAKILKVRANRRRRPPP